MKHPRLMVAVLAALLLIGLAGVCACAAFSDVGFFGIAGCFLSGCFLSGCFLAVQGKAIAVAEGDPGVV